MTTLHAPIINPDLPYLENIQKGPFGAYENPEEYQETKKPTYDFLGHTLYLPFGIPAGPLPSSRHINAAFKLGFDVAVYKTVRSKEFAGNPWPNLMPVHVEGNLTPEKAQAGVVTTKEYTVPIAITNSYGVPSAAPDVWMPDMANIVKSTPKGKLVICSFQGTTQNGDVEAYVADFAKTAKMVKDTGAEVMEVNLSCPNEGSAHLLCFDIERSIQVAKAIKDQIGDTPLFLKLAYFPDKAELKKLIDGTKDFVAGYSVINTIASKVINEAGEQAFPGNGRAFAGVSGEPIRWAGLEMVKQLDAWRKELGYTYKIIGLGGVLAPEHYKQYRDAGADVVLSAAGTMWNPFLAQEIKKAV